MQALNSKWLAVQIVTSGILGKQVAKLDLDDEVEVKAGNTRFVRSANTEAKNIAREPRRVPSAATSKSGNLKVPRCAERAYRSEM